MPTIHKTIPIANAVARIVDDRRGSDDQEKNGDSTSCPVDDTLLIRSRLLKPLSCVAFSPRGVFTVMIAPFSITEDP
jgi:hypothetical protein